MCCSKEATPLFEIPSVSIDLMVSAAEKHCIRLIYVKKKHGFTTGK
jgi:hypothetical protein